MVYFDFSNQSEHALSDPIHLDRFECIRYIRYLLFPALLKTAKRIEKYTLVADVEYRDF